MIRFAILLTLVVSNAKASDNGKYYACDTSILNSDNQCIFALTGEHFKRERITLDTRNCPRFFVRVGHQTTYASIGNKYF